MKGGVSGLRERRNGVGARCGFLHEKCMEREVCDGGKSVAEMRLVMGENVG